MLGNSSRRRCSSVDGGARALRVRLSLHFSPSAQSPRELQSAHVISCRDSVATQRRASALARRGVTGGPLEWHGGVGAHRIWRRRHNTRCERMLRTRVRRGRGGRAGSRSWPSGTGREGRGGTPAARGLGAVGRGAVGRGAVAVRAPAYARRWAREKGGMRRRRTGRVGIAGRWLPAAGRRTQRWRQRAIARGSGGGGATLAGSWSKGHSASVRKHRPYLQPVSAYSRSRGRQQQQQQHKQQHRGVGARAAATRRAPLTCKRKCTARAQPSRAAHRRAAASRAVV